MNNTKPKALVTQPLKTSQATGAILATLGLQKSIPLLHSAQGCTAFAKVALIQHFREPMPIQTTAMDQISAVMGADDNISEALQLLQQKHQPEWISLISTGLSDMQGCDLKQAVKNSPNIDQDKVVCIDAPDFIGSLQTGFAKAVLAFVQHATRHLSKPLKVRPRQINILVSSALTCADIEWLYNACQQFKLDPIVLPDTGRALNGHLSGALWQPYSDAGSDVNQLSAMAQSIATLVIGSSMRSVGDYLQQRFDIPCLYQDEWMGLKATDDLLLKLQTLSDAPMPAIWQTQRQALQDTLLDTHAILSNESVIMASETDECIAYHGLLREIGLHVLQTLVPCERADLQAYPHFSIGDLSAVEWQRCPRFVIGNSHLAFMAEQHHTPTHRMGFPVFDRLGIQDQLQIGYQGARHQLITWANLVLADQSPQVPVHRSHYPVIAESDYAV